MRGTRRADELPEHGTEVPEGQVQPAGSGVLERSQPPSASAGKDESARCGPGQRLYAAALRDAGGRQPVSLRLHAGYLEPGTIPEYRGIKQDRPGVTGIWPGKSCMLTEDRYKVKIIS